MSLRCTIKIHVMISLLEKPKIPVMLTIKSISKKHID